MIRDCEARNRFLLFFPLEKDTKVTRFEMLVRDIISRLEKVQVYRDFRFATMSLEITTERWL